MGFTHEGFQDSRRGDWHVGFIGLPSPDLKKTQARMTHLACLTGAHITETFGIVGMIQDLFGSYCGV